MGYNFDRGIKTDRRGDGIMANASFMSMRWLRLHIKEIIWATVILFVGSIFVIGYGTSRQIQNQEERKKMAEEAERKASERKNTAPAHLQSKLSLPVAHISFPTQTASLTSVIDVKTLWNSIKDSPEYQQVSNMPTGIKEFYGGMIKERALESLITISLVDLYAQANNIKPQITAQAIVERDRQQITPVEFDRELRRKGITTDEWGSERLKQLTMQAVAQSIVKPIPPASATEEVLKNYYETNKIRFMEDDQISFNHLLVSPSNFAGKAELNDEQIKSHFDAHRSDFMSSERVQLTHIMIKNEDEGYLNSIEVNDKEVRRRYTDNIEKYKNPEKVKASHILIKPKNSFDHDFASYKIAMRNFVIAESDAGTLVTFDASLANLGPDSNLDFDSFAVKTSDGKLFYPSISSQEKAENALELPLSGSTRNSVSGQIAIDLEKGTQPAELLIKDGTVTATFDISSAFDNEKAFAAARAEIEKIAELIKGGKDFAELARSRSQDTGSAAKGGDLGAFARGSMVKPFEDMAFTSNVGQISEPVRTQFGYHLIKVEEKIPEKVRSIDEVRAELIKEYQLEQADMKASASLESIRQKIIHKSESIEKLAKENSMGGARKSNGLLP
ncbi:MAG: peptidylprolyl isomerase, partial [Candidatus Rifleibacteriota bacterium]